MYRRIIVFLTLMILLIYGSNSFASTIYVTDHGVNGNDSNDDTMAIRNVVSALNSGDTLVFPECSNFYKVSVNSNFLIDTKNNITIIIRGRIRAEGTPTSGNQVFRIVYSDNIQIIGEGGDAIIEGSGEYMYTVDTSSAAPTLITLVVSNNCTIRNLTIRDGLHYYVGMWSCKKNTVTDCVFEGGPTIFDGSSTQIHGLFIRGSWDVTVKSNSFIVGSTGGKSYEWVGGSEAGERLTIVDNYFQSSFDHAIYCTSMNYGVIANNRIHDSGGAAIKAIGFQNIISNNNIYNSSDGCIEIRNASNCIVANNIIDGFTHVGIIVYIYGSPSGGIYSNNVIEGNFIRGLTGGDPYEAIRLWSADISGNKIINNTIINADSFGTHLGSIVAYSTDGISYNLTISGNIIDQCGGNGLYLYNIQDSLISDNIMNIPTGRIHFNQQGSTSNNLKIDNITTFF